MRGGGRLLGKRPDAREREMSEIGMHDMKDIKNKF